MSWISHLLAMCKESPIKFGRTMETQPSRDRISQATRKMFEVHIMVHFILVKQFLSAMIKSNHGHIVTVASMASFMTQAQNVDYACTKAAVLAFHEGLGQKLKYRYKTPKARTTSSNFNDFCLGPETVADVIVKHLYSGYGGQLILPERLSIMSGARGFPSWLQEFLRGTMSRTLEAIKH
ncbi:hypothetical protein N7537_006633 [Penicillium hordei]|uniref:Uncharacterized protein n=1 Tax=Penicillium hordei TaxID=40994 RepID=A0AAD6E7T9_9EURO|nr:uncharacterized protein N7537_006633 [Penicillium hordei]KAJ5603677.1 hypothetical protein N7537_006633 [Penicillium hordei]